MSSTLYIFTQDEHSLTLPVIAEVIKSNKYFKKYVVIFIEDTFSPARILKNLVFFGSIQFAKVACLNLIKKVDLENLDCQILHLSPKEFRSCQWFNLLDSNIYGLSINCPIKISEKIIKQFNWNILNVHNSLLPRYGGLMPVLRQVMQRDFCFGSTIHLINANLDEGRIVYQYCLMKARFISPYKIWTTANSINQSLLCSLSPQDYEKFISMDLSEKSYYSTPSWPDLLKFWINKTAKNISGLLG